MYWRVDSKTFDAFWGRGSERGAANKAAMSAIVAEGREPGLLAYVDGVAVGWCSVAPRSEYPRLGASRPLKPVDDTPVWSVVCFYIHGSKKRRGIAGELLRAAVAHAVSRGATTVEGYPVEPGDGDPYTGYRTMFEAAGFRLVREGGRRSVMRYSIREG